MTTVSELLRDGRVDRRDAEILIQCGLCCDRTWLITHGDEILASEQLSHIEHLMDRRAAGEPLAYITGTREFWGLDLAVAPAVLIPRPDTELLVEWAVTLLTDLSLPKVLDLGAGSGAVALAMKRECPAAAVTATDISPDALAVAAGNGRRLNLEVSWIESDWFTALTDGNWPLIVSNPPYIAAEDAHLRAGGLPFEPQLALVSGEDGLDALRHIIATAPDHLSEGGWLLLEHGYDQGEAVRALILERGFEQVSTRRDLGGQERVTGGCWRAQ